MTWVRTRPAGELGRIRQGSKWRLSLGDIFAGVDDHETRAFQPAIYSLPDRPTRPSLAITPPKPVFVSWQQTSVGPISSAVSDEVCSDTAHAPAIEESDEPSRPPQRTRTLKFPRS